MRLQDVSAKGGPLRVSGAMLFQDNASKTIRYVYQIEGSVANVSGKGIVLMVIHFRSTGVDGPSLDYTYQDDRFFSLDVLDAAKVESFRSPSLKFGAPTVNGQPMQEDVDTKSGPVATAQVKFVQFIDGSTWGDPQSGRELGIVRNQTVQEISRLKRVLADSGEQALKSELSKIDNPLPSVGSVIHDCDGKAASCVADGLRSMIEAVRQHQVDTKAKPAGLGDAVP